MDRTLPSPRAQYPLPVNHAATSILSLHFGHIRPFFESGMELNLSIEFFLDRLVFEPLGFRSQIESVSYNFLADQPRPVS
jgi:hypothetical protein